MSISSPRLVTLTMPASDASALKDFYNALFELGLSRSIKGSNESYQTWASAGVKWNISDRYADTETTMPHFAVPNLEIYAKKVLDLGGKVFGDPVDLRFRPDFLAEYRQKFQQFKFGRSSEVTETLGRFLPCADPQENRFGIIQLEEWSSKLFAGGEVSKLEWAEQEASKQNAQLLETMKQA